MPGASLPIRVPRPPECPACRRPNPVPVEDSKSCAMCDDGRLRIEDLEAAAETDEEWRLVAATLADAWFMAWAEGDRPAYVLNEAGTLMYDDGDPFVPDSNRAFHYSTLRLFDEGVGSLVETFADGRSWKAVRKELDATFERKVTHRVREHAAERLTEEDPATLGLLAAEDRPMVREAASLALKKLKKAGRIASP